MKIPNAFKCSREPYPTPKAEIECHPEVVLFLMRNDAAIIVSALMSSINFCKAFLNNEKNPAERKELLTMKEDYQSVLERFFPDHCNF